MQACPAGQVTFMQPSWQAPFTHTVAGGLQAILSQPLSTHRGVVAEQVCPLAQAEHSHGDTQTPIWQTWPLLHVVPPHRSTHAPDTHAWPFGQATPAQPPWQLPAMQI